MPSIFLSSLIFFPSFIFIFYLLILFLEYGNAIFQATSNSLAQANPLTARTVNYGCAPATAPQRQACHRPALTQPNPARFCWLTLFLLTPWRTLQDSLS